MDWQWGWQVAKHCWFLHSSTLLLFPRQTARKLHSVYSVIPLEKLIVDCVPDLLSVRHLPLYPGEQRRFCLGLRLIRQVKDHGQVEPSRW